MKDSWPSMCVFVPTFESMMRGEESKQEKASVTTDYEKPTKNSWLFCVGRHSDLANKFWPEVSEFINDDHSKPITYTQYIYKLYCETKKNLVKQKAGGKKL